MSGQFGGPDFFSRLALRRVQAGHFHATDRGYTGMAGRPVQEPLAQALRALHAEGCLTEGAPDQFGRRPVTLTVAGAIRLSNLGSSHG